MNKYSKIISGFLGISMLSFGVLKFVNPFKTWFTLQVSTSELPLPNISYWAGQLGEISVGIVFLWLVYIHKGKTKQIFYLANFLTIIMMIAAFYVHLHPNVPADILPMKIKPPFIPGLFLLLPMVNIYIHKRSTL